MWLVMFQSFNGQLVPQTLCRNEKEARDFRASFFAVLPPGGGVPPPPPASAVPWSVLQSELCGPPPPEDRNPPSVLQ